MERDEQAQVQPSDPSPEAADTVDPEAGLPLLDPEDGAGAGEERLSEDLEGHHLLELWSDREEIHALPEILRPAEGLVAVGSGTVVKSARLAQSNWLVVLTDRRLLCIKGRSAVTRKVIDMPVSQIRGVEPSGLIRKTLALDTGYGTLRLSGLKKSFAQEMVEGLTALMGAYSESAAEKATAIPKADISKAGARGHTHEELHAFEEQIGRLKTSLGELTDRVSFLEELVRSNVAGSARPQSGAGQARPAAAPTRPAGKPAPQGGKPTPQAGKPVPQPGKPAPQAGNPAPPAGKPAPQAGNPTPPAGTPTPPKEESASEEDRSDRAHRHPDLPELS